MVNSVIFWGYKPTTMGIWWWSGWWWLEHGWIMTFHSVGNFIIDPNWRIPSFFRGVGRKTTNQKTYFETHPDVWFPNFFRGVQTTNQIFLGAHWLSQALISPPMGPQRYGPNLGRSRPIQWSFWLAPEEVNKVYVYIYIYYIHIIYIYINSPSI